MEGEFDKKKKNDQCSAEELEVRQWGRSSDCGRQSEGQGPKTERITVWSER